MGVCVLFFGTINVPCPPSDFSHSSFVYHLCLCEGYLNLRFVCVGVCVCVCVCVCVRVCGDSVGGSWSASWPVQPWHLS